MIYSDVSSKIPLDLDANGLYEQMSTELHSGSKHNVSRILRLDGPRHTINITPNPFIEGIIVKPENMCTLRIWAFPPSLARFPNLANSNVYMK